MKYAVIYARVSSKEQEREGYSIPVQLDMLRKYAEKNDFRVCQEFVDVETAKQSGRKHFSEMVQFVADQKAKPVILVEKTDRLYRNFDDYMLLRNLGIDLHFVKEGRVIGKDSKSQDRLAHDLNLVIAKNYSDNLREEVRKGMEGRAAAGWFPGKSPFGYKNANRIIEIHPEASWIVTRIFEIFATGDVTLSELRRKIRVETGKSLSKAYLAVLLKNPFYIGFFEWQGKRFSGKHPIFIDPKTFEEVQRVFTRSGKPGKYRKHSFAFSGLMRCAHDGCTVTAGLQKSKYIYYRCTGHRGKCDLPYMREEMISEKLGQLLRNIEVPEAVAQAIIENLRNSQKEMENKNAEYRLKLLQRITGIRNRMDQAYNDKLDGKITPEYWERKSAEWQAEEQALQIELLNSGSPTSDFLPTVEKVFELAQRAYSLYVTRKPHEQAELLKKVLLNCATDGVSLTPTYRKPFDLIFQRAKNQEWSGREDLNLRPPGPEPGALPG